MHQGQLVFAQLMRHLPSDDVPPLCRALGGEHKVKSFSCLDQYLCMAFAQLTYRESLRDIESCLRAQVGEALSHGDSRHVSRNTWPMPMRRATGVSTRASRALDRHARGCTPRNLRRGLEGDGLRARRHDDRSVFVGLSVGAVSSSKAAVKLHTLLDLRGNIPVLFISATARCTRSTCSTTRCRSLVPTT